MKLPKTEQKTFEKLVVDEWLNGVIKDIQYDENHKFTWQGEEQIKMGVRFVFDMEGYTFPHYSGWLKGNLSEKSNLYKRYVSALVKEAKPDMDIDLDVLKGMKIKAIWEENENGFQRVLKIKPVGQKVDSAAKQIVNDYAEEFEPEFEQEE